MSQRPKVSEAEFQKQVIRLARLHGWRVAHFRTAPTVSGKWATAVQGDGKGFPDLVLVREKVIFAELKVQGGRLRPEQAQWLDWLSDAGVSIFVWRPDDLDSINVILGAPRLRAA